MYYFFFQFYILLTLILLLELVCGILIFIFYYIPSVRKSLGFLEPEDVLKQAIVRYRDDHDLRDMIDEIQRSVSALETSHSFLKDQRELLWCTCSG